jgi:hypothetical protein
MAAGDAAGDGDEVQFYEKFGQRYPTPSPVSSSAPSRSGRPIRRNRRGQETAFSMKACSRRTPRGE